MLDLLIKGGEVIDGTGAPRQHADVGVRDGRIVADPDHEDARRVIDADGLVVTPGWIEVHTHYDTQVFWDPDLSPAPLHGATTVIAGHCSFSLVPAVEEQAEYVLRMFARVEGMPYELLAQGIRWGWRSPAEMIDRVEADGVALNVAMLVGHSSLRRAVMGGRAGARATDDDLAAMSAVLDDALACGFAGLSTSFNPDHRDGDLEPVPSIAADARERALLAEVVGRRPGTTLQAAPGARLSPEIVDAMIGMSLAADRPMNWGGHEPGVGDPEKHHALIAAAEQAWARGAYLKPLVRPERFPYVLTLASGFMFDTIPGWLGLFQLGLSERMDALRDPAVRRRLVADADATPQWSAVSELHRWSDHVILETFADENRGLSGRTVGDIARERGISAFDALVDVSLADDLRTVALAPSSRDDDATWRLRAQLATDPHFMVGGSDGGAHMDMHCGAAFVTGMLAQMRDRELMSLERAVQSLTGDPARHFGLHDRGRVANGCRADLVVFDPATVGPGPMSLSRDLPHGAMAIFQPGAGIEHVFVNGTAVAEHGRPTGVRPGTVLRAGRDLATVTNSAALAWV